MIDAVRRHLWSDPRVLWFHVQNTLLYVHRDALTPALREEFERTKDWPLRLVHPTRYLASADLSHARVRPLLRVLPTAIYHGLKRTFSRQGLSEVDTIALHPHSR